MVCKCSNGISNTGFDCTVNGSVIQKLIFTNLIKADGTPNVIDFQAEAVGGVIPQAVIEAKINDPIASQRWYPVGGFENIEDLRADPITESFNSGNTVKIKEGIRSFSGLLLKKSPKYLQSLESFGCQSNIGVYAIDSDGNLVGESFDDNTLRPIKIDNNTLSASYVKTTDAEVSKIALSFNYAQTVSDRNLSLITAEGFETDLKNVRGLLDVTMSTDSTGATATGIDVEAVINYGGSINDRLFLTTLEASDFVVNNETQSAIVVVDSVDLSTASVGAYGLRWSSGVSVGDTLRITATKKGFEIDPLVTVTK